MVSSYLNSDSLCPVAPFRPGGPSPVSLSRRGDRTTSRGLRIRHAEFSRYRLPSTSTLLAFESAARNSSFSQAASELGTSQSAISRHIGDLESQLGARLFERSARGVSLTEPGAFFHEIVVSGLDAIHSGVVAAANVARTNLLVIACSHETSHFLVMPRFDALRRTLGEHVRIRILTYHYDLRGQLDRSGRRPGVHRPRPGTRGRKTG